MLNRKKTRWLKTGQRVFFIYILPTNRVTDQSPSPLSNVKSIKKPWKHWTERRQKSCKNCWLCKNRKSTTQTECICLFISKSSTEQTSTTTFRWPIMESRTEMPCVTPKWLSPCTKKASNSFPTTIATIIWVWSSTALDGRTRAFCWTVVYRQTTPYLLINGYAT